MKKPILICALAILAVQAPGAPGSAEEADGSVRPRMPTTYNVLLAGGPEPNRIHVWLSGDGRSYVIDSVVPLEVGGNVCANPEGNPNELLCRARIVAGFEVNADGGDDVVVVAKDVSIPVTLRGGAGDDFLRGGGGNDKLIGGSGDDRLAGLRGDDAILGGPGNDVLVGHHGDDVLIGGLGRDLLRPGHGNDVVRQNRPRRRQRPARVPQPVR